MGTAQAGTRTPDAVSEAHRVGCLSASAGSAASPRAPAMTTLRDRKTYRNAILRCLYGAVERNRPEVSGAVLREQLRLPDDDLSAACAYLVDEGLITVDWTSHRTPASASLTHEGVRYMEEEEESGEPGSKG
jgi:hypothetical protein